MSDNPRIAELRRRVESDPASIAFAQLAEEYRREGDYERAVDVCRTGLAQYPSYLSARVTLGRALAELGLRDEAEAELQRVLQVAPDNIAARRAMEELASRPKTETAAPAPEPPPPQPPVADPRLQHLESWLDAILRERAQRAGRPS